MAELREALAIALADDPLNRLVPLFHPDVTWGDCAGAEQAAAFVESALGEGFWASDVLVADLGDRFHAAMTVEGIGELHLVVFEQDGLIGEMRICDSVDSVARVHPLGRLADAAARPVQGVRLSPVFSVASVSNSVEHYRLLGFDVQEYEGDDAYAFAVMGGMEIHLQQDDQPHPARVYLYVDDADALYARWRVAGVPGRTIAPEDTEYGMREGAHFDPDGNILRFGS